MIAFILAALFACAFPTHAASCGKTLMYNNFNKYSGGYQTYTKAMMQKDFPAGANKIMTSQGQLKPTGLVFLKFDRNAEVGQGMFRAKNPKGMRFVYGLRLARIWHALTSTVVIDSAYS